MENTDMATLNTRKYSVKSVCSNWEPPSIMDFSINDFKMNEIEQEAKNSLLISAISCMMYKVSVEQNLPEKAGKSFQTFLEMSSMPQRNQECSNVIYLDIINEYADDKNTILNTLALLQERLEVGTKTEHLCVVGDGKTYDHLHALKVEYDKELSWLVPLPGDWHILKNYQEVLLKVYFEGGLKDMAKLSGYSEGILNSIGGASKFKRSNGFILKSWEAILRTFLTDFVAINTNAEAVAEQINTILSSNECTEPDVPVLFKLLTNLCKKTENS